jgi:hypothetical protein
VAFSHSELIVGDFWLIMGINALRVIGTISKNPLSVELTGPPWKKVALC